MSLISVKAVRYARGRLRAFEAQRGAQGNVTSNIMRSIERFVILPCAIVTMLISATAAGAMQGGGGARMTNPTTAEVGIAPDVSVYGASLAFGRRWDAFRVSASIPYYFVRNGESENGLGDVRVIGEWDIVPPAPQRLSLIGSLLWKIPTADENKGLGTGETDFGAFAEIDYTVGRNKPFFNFGYLRKGDTPTVDYRDTWLYSLGVSHYIGADEVYGSFDTRQSVLPGFDDTKLLSAGWLHNLTASRTLRFDGSIGLNSASPDTLINVEFMIWF